ncbi:MAG: NADH-dependent [FeFe] hydrogenase, group A6 [Clostridia bacterium]|nr:NADH-dependent [FeFe] hydrogenase, group A6 [Clostridia bacterium]
MYRKKKMITLTIDSRAVTVPEGTTILEAARKIDIDIPTLCFLKEINEVGDCRMCLVEIEGVRGYKASCVYPVEEGLVVRTNTKGLIDTKRTILELLLSSHEKKCLTCVRSTNCRLQDLCRRFEIPDLEYEVEMPEADLDDSSECVVRNTAKCILCKRCVNVCKKVQGVAAISTMNRGFHAKVGVALDMGMRDSTCVGCGQCVIHCPVGALVEKSNVGQLREALADKNKIVIIQTAPAVRATIGEEFGMPIGTLVTGKMVAALRRIGFDKIFDTDLGADMTIMEEATEFIERLKSNSNLPMITSCSSGWITFAEKFYPELLSHLSSTKSPMEILGTLIKTYYAKKEGIDPKDIYSVALMPCSAKKAEIIRDELKLEGNIQAVDNVITTREMARMLKEANIDLASLNDEEYDNPLGEATGAGHIFGTTGGVMEAALRSVSYLLDGTEVKNVEFKQVRGTKAIKEATITIAGKEHKIAISQGLSNASILLNQIKDGTSPYSFIEVMTCPGGCINGGGQPIVDEYKASKIDVKGLRAKALYKADKKAKFRKSHENQSVQKIYSDFIGKPNGKVAHELLHTHYNKQEVYTEK